jgi:hypothetical protein
MSSRRLAEEADRTAALMAEKSDAKLANGRRGATAATTHGECSKMVANAATKSSLLAELRCSRDTDMPVMMAERWQSAS